MVSYSESPNQWKAGKLLIVIGFILQAVGIGTPYWFKAQISQQGIPVTVNTGLFQLCEKAQGLSQTCIDIPSSALEDYVYVGRAFTIMGAIGVWMGMALSFIAIRKDQPKYLLLAAGAVLGSMVVAVIGGAVFVGKTMSDAADHPEADVTVNWSAFVFFVGTVFYIPGAGLFVLAKNAFASRQGYQQTI